MKRACIGGDTFSFIKVSKQYGERDQKESSRIRNMFYTKKPISQQDENHRL